MPRPARRLRISGMARAVILAGATLVLAAFPASAQETRVTLTFLVQAPASTPPDATLWISGSLPELGNWSGAGVRLAPAGERLFRGSAEVPRGARVEFKVTRGDWETVEKDARGGEIANRKHLAARDTSLRLSVGAWRDQTEGSAAPRPHTLTGDIRHHPDFASRHVRARDVWVYLPPGYAADSTRHYPVLYLHDGNNVFDAATSFLGIEWEADETAERAIGALRLPAFVMVAVANTPDRREEYTPAADAQGRGGRAADYARFLVEELKPFIDRTYRTQRGPEATGTVGSSLGAVVSIYLAIEHPEVFGLVGALSPAAAWADEDIVRRVAAAERAGRRVWIDIGDREAVPLGGRAYWLDGARALRDAYRDRGYRDGADLHYEEVPGGEHDEAAWAARLERVLIFLLRP